MNYSCYGSFNDDNTCAQAQDMLADAVHMAFKQLVLVLQSELETVLHVVSLLLSQKIPSYL